MKAVVLINRHASAVVSGQAGDVDTMRRRFAESGAEAEIRVVDPRWLDQNVNDALGSGADVIIAAGGDGTLNTIANRLAGSDKALGVLPLGTHNHFAHGLNVPLELELAIAALARGRIANLPVGEVNGRVFLNFSAIGIMPEEPMQGDTPPGFGWAAMPKSIWSMLWPFSKQHITLRSRGHAMARHAAGVIVCNNPHQMHAFGIDDANVPERGLLKVYIASRAPRGGLSRMLRRTSQPAHRLDSMALPEVTIESKRRHLRVSIDGEVFDMRGPLHYRMRPGGLRVLLPEPPMQVSPQAAKSA